MSGTIEAIHIADQNGEPLYPLERAELREGHGIVGDRNAHRGDKPASDSFERQVTLVEMEALEAVAAEHRITLNAADTRRNIATRGIRLNELVGKRFRIGEALCEGTDLCHPCGYLERKTGIGGLTRLLAQRGGLCARVLEGGTIQPGDPVEEDL